ncbi:hypothetical protein B0T22DRAFT_463882 [Podospora appendiculata]|uniref:Uncharacterized protein n=1 Tax=Podospora appendiculata TaxID=314037 RepID=A0AAE0XDB3_9PEZI|nr:hypothetical protein B0T22DRAFT_463882 [Podospora appendiculata]
MMSIPTPRARDLLPPIRHRHGKKRSARSPIVIEHRPTPARAPFCIDTYSQPLPRMWYVPDPPAWTPSVSSTSGGRLPDPYPFQTSSRTKDARSQIWNAVAPPSGQGHPHNPPRQDLSPSTSSKPIAHKGPASGLPTPPSTPVITRLATPDIDFPDPDGEFCACCTRKTNCVVGMSKMDLQLQNATRYMACRKDDSNHMWRARG